MVLSGYFISVLLLVGACAVLPASAIPVAKAQSFRAAAANERRPVPGMVSSLFGGIMGVFQGNEKSNEAEVIGRHVHGAAGRNDRSLLDVDMQGIFINAGGENYTDAEGITWVEDKGLYNTGNSHSTNKDISNTDKPTIYQSERWKSTMTYVRNTPSHSHILYAS